MFDENPFSEGLRNSFAGDEFARLCIISQEYALLQIVKLHDPAVVGGNITLGIDYILKYGFWDVSTLKMLESLRKELDQFASNLRSARNKILSHNDLAGIVAGNELGAFLPGEDVRYFSSLQEFVNLVHETVVGGPYPFDELVKNDVAGFLAMFSGNLRQ